MPGWSWSCRPERPGRFGGSDQTVVVIRSPILGLLRLEDADQPNGNETAGESRLLHEDEKVERISIFRERPGNRSEVERKDRARGKDVGDRVAATRDVVLELAGAALRRVDDDLKKSRRGIPGCQVGKR